MDENLKTKTLNGRLVNKGFRVKAAIPNRRLPESLAKIIIESARGEYKDIKIIPSELALKGYEWELEEQSHIVYVKYNQDYPGYNPNCLRVGPIPNFQHKETGDIASFSLQGVR